MFKDVKNKKFTNVVTNNSFTVTDQIDNIAVLDNNQRIDINHLLNPMYYDEYIDPNNFLNTNYDFFSKQIKSIPNDIVSKMSNNDSAILDDYNIEDEKRMVAEKYGVNTQQESIVHIKVEDSQNNNQEIISNINSINNVEVKEDPITTIFKNVKKNKEFSFNLNVNEKIPRLDFLEMMEDSYEISIIDYLADEFTKKLLSNSNSIKEKIADEIRSLINKKEVVKPIIKENPILVIKKLPKKVSTRVKAVKIDTEEKKN